MTELQEIRRIMATLAGAQTEHTRAIREADRVLWQAERLCDELLLSWRRRPIELEYARGLQQQEPYLGSNWIMLHSGIINAEGVVTSHGWWKPSDKFDRHHPPGPYLTARFSRGILRRWVGYEEKEAIDPTLEYRFLLWDATIELVPTPTRDEVPTPSGH